jgi:hypothetical protein
VHLPDDVPSPSLVAAWFKLGTLTAESVPMWAAHWLATGHDGLALAELASLSGRDPVEVREALPGALLDTGTRIPEGDEAAAKVALDELAHLHLESQGQIGT